MRFIWFLVPVESEDSTKWSKDIALAPILELPIEEPSGSSNYELLLKNYSKLSEGFVDESVGVTTGTKPVRRFKRSREARNLVIARSEFKCEYDKCTGMPPDVDSQGKPILQVDHILPLSEGGSDRPSNMIAICPNCHVAKTIGQNKRITTKQFLEIVSKKEKSLSQKV